MLRVLLAIDNYNEMASLQTLLRKLGFDVDGIQNQCAFAEKQLSFNPQIVLATARGHSMNGIELAKGIRRFQGVPHFILLVQPQRAKGLNLDHLKNVDGCLESPIDVHRLLEMISQVADIDTVGLMEKYNRMQSSLQSAATSEVREERFRKHLDNLDKPIASEFNREKVAKESKGLRQTEDKEGLCDLEKERQGFAKFLFTKNKRKKKSS